MEPQCSNETVRELGLSPDLTRRAGDVGLGVQGGNGLEK